MKKEPPSNFEGVTASEIAPRPVEEGERFRVEGKIYSYTGVVEDESSPDNGKPVGEVVGEEGIYKVFTPEELSWGLEEEYRNMIGETGFKDAEEDLKDYWEMEGCRNTHGEFVF